MRIKLFTLSALGLMLPSLAYASTPQLQGTYGDWQTYKRGSGNEALCYVLAAPQSKSPGNVKHGDIYFMVANWKSGAATEQPSFLAGYSLKTDSAPNARVGSAKYNMYVSQNEAFIEKNTDEKSLVKAMRAGSNMRLSAVSARGTAVTYEFSLKGITAALKKAKEVCR